MPRFSHLSPKLAARHGEANHGSGVFAVDPVEEGELLAVWGGRIIGTSELPGLTERERMLTLQVEEGFLLAPGGEADPADLVNHSCDPNAGLRGQISLVAMRAIEPGEEICFDYAMSEGTAYDEFTCTCGSDRCRGEVTADDWRRPELWERYAGYFSPYLAERIRRLREG